MDSSCPSCGGTSFSRSQDEGFLICDDCDEQCQDFRQEEMDDEDAGNFAVFTRQSQEAAAENRRLNSQAASARASMRAAAAERAVDFTSTLFRGVIVVSRAIVDALVEAGHLPERAVEPCRCIVLHWVRMCHVSGRVKARGAGETNFKPSTILAMVSLAALYVRSSLLPRDLCVLAAKKEIPFVTAGTDLLPREAMEDPRIRACFTPHMVYAGPDVAHLAASIALSDYAWPPIRAFFDGPRKLYTMKMYRAFPVGDMRTTILRLCKVLGLSEKFCDRVLRFRELRMIAAVAAQDMNRSASGLKKDGAKAKPIAAMAAAQKKKYSVRFESDDELKDMEYVPGAPNIARDQMPEPGSQIMSQDVDSDGAVPPAIYNREQELSAKPNSEVLNCSVEPLTQDEHVPKHEQPGNRKRLVKASVFSYSQAGGVGSLSFTPPFGEIVSVKEFATTRSILVDMVCAGRLCYGDPESAAALEPLDNELAKELRREWSFCVQRMQMWVLDGGCDSENILWSGLSPMTVHNMKGKALKSFVEDAHACTSEDIPLFMNDDAQLFLEIASESHNAHRYESTDADMLDPAQDPSESCEGENSSESLFRIGNWVWDHPLEASEIARSLSPVMESLVDEPTGAVRSRLLHVRGLISKSMESKGFSRALLWATCQKREHDMWDEPAALGWMIVIITCFFHGTPGFVNRLYVEDKAYDKHIARCCDVALTNVFNYVDIHLGEEGTLDVHRTKGGSGARYATSSRMQGVGSGFVRK